MIEVDIDMSGRIEETTRPTVLALANGKSRCIQINASEKRIVLDSLRKMKPHWSRTYVNVIVFSILICLLFEDRSQEIGYIVIDPEYEGHDAIIKDRVMNHFRRLGIVIRRDQIDFRRVGKRSPAHDLAIRVFRGKSAPDREISARDVLAEL